MEVPNRMELEKEAVKKVGHLSSRHRDELAKLMGSPPDIRNVPGSFWDKVRTEHAAELTALLALIFAASAESHGLPISKANEAGQAWASVRAQQVATDFTANVRDTLSMSSDRWRETVRQQAAPGESGSGVIPQTEVDETLESAMGGARAERLGITETTRAQHAGSETAVAQTVGISPEDVWHTVEDGKVCPFCRPLNMTPRTNWGRFFPGGPPDPHPNCRCYIEYANRGEVAGVKPNPADAPAGSPSLGESILSESHLNDFPKANQWHRKSGSGMKGVAK